VRGERNKLVRGGEKEIGEGSYVSKPG